MLKTLEKSNVQFLDEEIYSDHCLAKLIQEASNLINEKDKCQYPQGLSDKFIWLDERRKCIAFASSNGPNIVASYQELGFDQFEEHLWKIYLGLVNLRPLFPAIYPVLRKMKLDSL